MGLHLCTVSNLLEFDQRYSHVFAPFFSFLQSDQWKVSEEVIEVLPQTSLVISKPLIKALK